MSPDIELEKKVIERFIVKNKQNRYLAFINKSKTRKKFTDELAHFSSQLHEFDEIQKDEFEVINSKTRFLKKPIDCYIISENSDIDGKRMGIENAITETIGFGSGTLLVFGDAELVYYEGEGPSDRWISKKIKTVGNKK